MKGELMQDYETMLRQLLSEEIRRRMKGAGEKLWYIQKDITYHELAKKLNCHTSYAHKIVKEGAPLRLNSQIDICQKLGIDLQAIYFKVFVAIEKETTNLQIESSFNEFAEKKVAENEN